MWGPCYHNIRCADGVIAARIPADWWNNWGKINISAFSFLRFFSFAGKLEPEAFRLRRLLGTVGAAAGQFAQDTDTVVLFSAVSDLHQPV